MMIATVNSLPGKSGMHRYLQAGLLLYATLLQHGQTSAGAYIFAGEMFGIDAIAHPSNYFNSGGVINVRVCIVPGSTNAAAMQDPVKNIVNTFNALQPTTSNLVTGAANNLAPNQFDFESVALHEIGHCLGLAHVNAASESGLGEPDANYTKATDGANNSLDLNKGADNVIGSSDDLRGDDANLHWFRISNNNPFTIDSPVDSTTYARGLGQLPPGHTFAANGDRIVANLLLGSSDTEAVMQQLTFNDEAQRTLIHDDVATLRYAASGTNEIAGDSDDYTINVVYAGISSMNCDINLSFDNAMTGFAVCQASATNYASNHWRITSANIYFNTGFNWFYNPQTTDTDGDGLDDDFEINVLGTNPNLVDTDGDGLVDGAGGVVLLADLPTGIDSDNDGFVDGEQDFGTNPLLVDTDGDQLADGLEVAFGSNPTNAGSWPNIADGDLAPLGNPDGNVNAADLLIALRILQGDIIPLALQFAHGDLYPPGSPDDIIDLSDALLLQKLILGLP